MTSKKDLVRVDYQGIEVSFLEDGWFNATQAAEKFGKRVDNYLALIETKQYIDFLAEDLNPLEPRDLNTPKRGYLIWSRRGKNGGTWFHPELAIHFARWLDARFSIWCDRQIRAILSGTHVHYDWKRLRHEASSSFKVMNEALRLVREEQGKLSQPHHYSNEARLINWALTGHFRGLDRNSLDTEELNLLAKLEVKNSVLISRGVIYHARKQILEQYAIDLRPVAIAGPAEPPLITE